MRPLMYIHNTSMDKYYVYTLETYNMIMRYVICLDYKVKIYII